MRILIVLVILISLSSCGTYYVNVKNIRIDRSSLASTFARTPDRASVDPPRGQDLVVEWRLPHHYHKEDLHIVLKVIYKNLESAEFTYSVKHPVDFVTYHLIGEEFKRTQGIMTYKAEIVDGKGEVVKEYVHMMWIDRMPTNKNACFDELKKAYEENWSHPEEVVPEMFH
ncbi:MAG: hypothetical protein S4CHLAM102_03470 [Chlamydiia bacterium]|nr:hypothetical protein [Chlamydiia bacterium]